MTPIRTTWHMDLRQLTVYEQFRWINMCAVTFSFVDQSSSRGLKKFGEKIPGVDTAEGNADHICP